MPDDAPLAGRVALVTGANHGIGAATARAFAGQGAAVFITYLRYPPDGGASGDATTPGRALYRRLQMSAGDDVAASIQDSGGRAAAWEADLTDTGAIPILFDRAEAALGPVDILINNAAFCEADTFLPASLLRSDSLAPGGMRMRALDPAAIDHHFAVNSRAVALLTAEYARRSIDRGARWGRVINVSTDGASGFPGEISYGASKHAMESYSRAAATELGLFGITVNVVSLGPVQTGWISPEIEARGMHDIPLRRLGQPEDVADVILFLASEQARWVTGQLLYVGGGHAMPL